MQVFPDFKHSYVINGEVYLLGFDPEQVSSKLTDEGKALAEALYTFYLVSLDTAYSFINLITQNGNSIRSFREQVEAYIAVHAMTEQFFPSWFAVLQLVDKVESKYAGWGIGLEARTYLDVDQQRFHLRCN